MAVTLTAEQLTEEAGGNLSRATRVLAVATEKVREYLGSAYADAPKAICNEAVIRFGGYLMQSDYGGSGLRRKGRSARRTRRITRPCSARPARWVC